jgi:hypothetical protein
MEHKQTNDNLIVSFLTLRRLIGILGIALPVAALAYSLTGDGTLEVTISTYYHTGIRDIFVAILCATGVFMLVYKGYDRRDTIASSFAGACAICVGFFPTDATPTNSPIIVEAYKGVIHEVAAAGLFLTFAYMSVVLFTKSEGEMTPQKKKRNVVYKTCGYVIFTCIALMFSTSKLPNTLLALKPFFWFETIALFAFGVSWLVKGETILKDAPVAEEDDTLGEEPVFALQPD